MFKAALAASVEDFRKAISSRTEALTLYMETLKAWNIGFEESKKALEVAEEGYKLASKLEYDRGLAFAWRNLGIYRLIGSKGQVEESMDYLLNCLKWFEENNEKEGESTALMALGTLYWNFGDFQKGINFMIRALQIAEEYGNWEGIGWGNHSLGSFYYDWKDYHKSMDHFQKAYDIFVKTDYVIGQARCLNGLGNAH
ncbi:MAG: tetratricopeptide repeat protein, partial [bacterium]|nr:tetratricopeptide repeat protein [bacterium]